MTENHYFADVDLPFHVWVRERTAGRGFRWVLREAPQLKRNSPQASGPAGDTAGGRRSGPPL